MQFIVRTDKYSMGHGSRFARLVAAIIDGIFSGVLTMIIGFFAFLFIAKSGMVSQIGTIESPDDIPSWLLYFISACVGSWIIYSLTEVFFAATPGKLILGLRIRNCDNSPASTLQLFGRWFVKCGLLALLEIMSFALDVNILHKATTATNLLLFFGTLLIFSSTRQTIWDRAAETVVDPVDLLPVPTTEAFLFQRKTERVHGKDPSDLLKPRW